jgi:hypothetical protein
MFIRNGTRLDVQLARGHVSDELAVAAVVVFVALDVGPDDALAPRATPLSPVEGDPPRDRLGVPLWAGVSVTASGHVGGPARAPFVSPAFFRVGAAERRVIVFGDRRWERGPGRELVPSAPAPFDRMDLRFERAFGGGYDLPPGLLPGTDLPHPGLRVAYPLNEGGVGFYPSEQAAAGSPLPNVERPDQLLRKWNDAPEPAGFAPCPDLLAWRMRDEQAAAAQRGASLEAPAAFFPGVLRMYHHAPPSLIFDDLPPGTPIALEGLGARAIRFVVPASPAHVTVSRRANAVRPRLRALHVDADRRAVLLVYDHAFNYETRRAPGWVRVQAAEGAAS